MTPFSDLLAGLKPSGDAFTVEVTPDWMQGRTTYGGLSGAIFNYAYPREVHARHGMQQ